MKVFEILDNLQIAIENAPNVPLTNKVMIDKDEILDMIDDLRGAIPLDMEEARKIIDELEEHTSREFWPYPTYTDLLFSVN